MKKLNVFLVFLFLTGVCAAEKAAVFRDISDPGGIHVDGERIYIVERASILIYSSKDYKFIKKFGKRGEGPGEFRTGQEDHVLLYVQPDYLQVNSQGKIVFFKKDGTYIKEIATPVGRWLRPLGKKYVGMRYLYDDDGTRYHVVSLYDSDCQKIKEIYREKAEIQIRLKTIDAVSWTRQIFRIYNEKIFIDSKNKGIQVLDNKGNKCYDIPLDYEQIKVTENIKQKYITYYKKESPFWRTRWERLKNWYQFPDYLPVIRNFFVINGKIYIQTFKEKNDRSEILVLDTDSKGKLLKRAYLPLVKNGLIFYYSWTISNGKLYQLVENDDDKWELHVTKIE